jgi:predicted Zn-dependent protease
MSTFLLLLHAFHAADAAAEDVPVTAEADLLRIQRVVDDLRVRLDIPDAVRVAISPDVPLVFAVEAPGNGSQMFRLTIDIRFLVRLTTDELRAALAHELGHVWVFTHHPYLQTEGLANQIAMRVVSRESLADMYRKLWEYSGTTGDLATILGS